jgi:hypothetical protein
VHRFTDWVQVWGNRKCILTKVHGGVGNKQVGVKLGIPIIGILYRVRYRVHPRGCLI